MNTYTVTNTNDSGEGSLRWAIEQVNAYTGEDTPVITFDAALAGQTIALASELSLTHKARIVNLTDTPVTIQGASLRTSADLHLEQMVLPKLILEGAAVLSGGENILTGNGEVVRLVNYSGTTSYLKDVIGNTTGESTYVAIQSVSGECALSDLSDKIPGGYRTASSMTLKADTSLTLEAGSCLTSDYWLTVSQGASLKIKDGGLLKNTRANSPLKVYGRVEAVFTEKEKAIDFLNSSESWIDVFAGGELIVDNIVLQEKSGIRIYDSGVFSARNSDITTSRGFEIDDEATVTFVDSTLNSSVSIRGAASVFSASGSTFAGSLSSSGILNMSTSTITSYLHVNGQATLADVTCETLRVTSKASLTVEGGGMTLTGAEAVRLIDWSGDTKAWFDSLNWRTTSEEAYAGISGTLSTSVFSALPTQLPGGYKLMGSVTIAAKNTVVMEEGVSFGMNWNSLYVEGTWEAQFEEEAVVATGRGNVYVRNGGEARLRNASINIQNYTVYIQNGGEMNMEGGKITADSTLIYEKGTLALSNVEVTCYLENYGTTTLTGCTLKNSFSNNNASSRATISDSTIAGWVSNSSGGMLELERCELGSFLQISDRSKVTGSGNTFKGNETFRLVNFTGNTNDVWIPGTFEVASETAYVGLNGNLYNATIQTAPENIPGGYKLMGGVTIAAKNTVVMEEGVSFGMNWNSLYVEGTWEAQFEEEAVVATGRGNVYVRNGGEARLRNASINIQNYTVYIQNGGVMNMEGGKITADSTLIYEKGTLTLSNVEVTGNLENYGTTTLAGCSLHSAVRAYFGAVMEIRDCLLESRLTLSRSAKSVVVTGCDLSRATMTLDGSGDTVMDLSGNYWGTTDIDAVIAKIGNYDASHVIIGSVLEYPPTQEFSFAADTQKLNKLSNTATELKLTFNRNVDARSITVETLRLVDEQGRAVAVQEFEINGRDVTLKFDSVSEGLYRLVATDGLKDTSGTSLTQRYDIYYSCEELVAPKILLWRNNSTVTDHFNYVEIYFDQAMAPGCVTADSMHIYSEKGRELKVERIVQSSASGNAFYRVYFETATERGNYTIQLDDTIAGVHGNALTGGYTHRVYVATPDLQVEPLIECEATQVGKYATITYTIVNRGDGTAAGNWVDTVYLCRGAEWNEEEAILFGRVVRPNEELESGASYTATVKGMVDVPVPGDYYIFVKTDASDAVSEADNANNFSAAGTRVALDVARQDYGVELTGTTDSANEVLYYRVVATETGTCRFSVHGEVGKMLVAQGVLPTGQTNVGKRFKQNEEHSLYFETIAGETYYVMVEPGRAGTYTTCLEESRFDLVRSSSSLIASGHDSTITVYGTNLTAETRFYLKDAQGNVYEAAQTNVSSALQATLTFSLPDDMEPGSELTLHAEDSRSGAEAELASPWAIAAYGDMVEVEFIDRMNGNQHTSRAGWIWKTNVTVRNTAGFDMENALILVTDTAEDFALYYDYEDAKIRDRSALILQAGNGDDSYGVFTGEESEKLGVYVKHYRSTSGHIGATILAPDDDTTISGEQWSLFESALRPGNTSDEDWAAWWGDMQPRIGNTVADFVRFVRGMQAHVETADNVKAGSSLADLTERAMNSSAAYVPSYRVSGTLTDGEGNPLRGVQIWIGRFEDGAWINAGSALTDENGFYSVAGLQTGSYILMSSVYLNVNGAEVNELEISMGQADTELNLETPLFVPLPDSEEQARLAVDGEGHVYRLGILNGKLVVRYGEKNGERSVTLSAADHISDCHALWSDKEGMLVVSWVEGEGNDADVFCRMGKWIDDQLWWSESVNLTNDFRPDSLSCLMTNSRGETIAVTEKNTDTGVLLVFNDVNSDSALSWNPLIGQEGEIVTGSILPNSVTVNYSLIRFDCLGIGIDISATGKIKWVGKDDHSRASYEFDGGLNVDFSLDNIVSTSVSGSVSRRTEASYNCKQQKVDLSTWGNSSINVQFEVPRVLRVLTGLWGGTFAIKWLNKAVDKFEEMTGAKIVLGASIAIEGNQSFTYGAKKSAFNIQAGLEAEIKKTTSSLSSDFGIRAYGAIGYEWETLETSGTSQSRSGQIKGDLGVEGWCTFKGVKWQFGWSYEKGFMWERSFTYSGPSEETAGIVTFEALHVASHHLCQVETGNFSVSGDLGASVFVEGQQKISVQFFDMLTRSAVGEAVDVSCLEGQNLFNGEASLLHLSHSTDGKGNLYLALEGYQDADPEHDFAQSFDNLREAHRIDTARVDTLGNTQLLDQSLLTMSWNGEIFDVTTCTSEVFMGHVDGAERLVWISEATGAYQIYSSTLEDSIWDTPDLLFSSTNQIYNCLIDTAGENSYVFIWNKSTDVWEFDATLNSEAAVASYRQYQDSHETPRLRLLTPVVEKSGDGTSSVTLNWKADHACRYRLAVDDVEYEVDKETSWTLDLPDGEHEYRVWAINQSGMSSEVSGTFSTDATAPNVWINKPVCQKIDEGRIMVAVTWSGDEEVVNYELLIDGRSVYVGSETNFRLEMNDGPHSAVVLATDSHGNTGRAGTGFTADATAPDVSLHTPRITVSQSGTVEGFFSWSDSSGCRYVLVVNGKEYHAGSSPWKKITLDSDITSWSVRATDQAGNVGVATDDKTYYLPIRLAMGDVQIRKNETKDGSIFVRLTWETSASAAEYTVWIDGKSYRVGNETAFEIELKDGEHSYRIEGKDSNLHYDKLSGRFSFDATAPKLAVNQPRFDKADGTRMPVSFAWKTDEAAEYRFYLDGELVYEGPENTFNTDMESGAHSYVLTATDQSGNTSSFESMVQIDASLPELTMEDPVLTRESDGRTHVQLSWASLAEGDTYMLLLDGTSYSLGEQTTWEGTLDDGVHVWSIQATSTNGASVEASASFLTDATAPEILVSEETIQKTAEGKARLVLAWASNDAISYVVTVDGQEYEMGSATEFSLDGLEEGEHVYSVRGRDAAGNESVVEGVVDASVSGPMIEFREPEITGWGPGESCVHFRWESNEDARYQLNVDGKEYTTSSEYYLVSGLKDGSHAYTFYAIDQNGNMSELIEGTFETDHTAPEFTRYGADIGASRQTTIKWNTDEPCSYQLWLDGTLHDLGGNNSYTASMSIGEHRYTIVATDASHNTKEVSGTFLIAPPVSESETPKVSENWMDLNYFNSILLSWVDGTSCAEQPEPDAKLPHQSFSSFDPNDIYGPQGSGKENWISKGEMAFQVECENIAKDNIAHAAMVTITQQMDEAFDWNTFRLGNMMLGGQYIEVPENTQRYKARLDWTASLGILVDVDAGIDLDTGLVTWSFVAIDPETLMVVSDPFSGLLAPNYESPEGEGLSTTILRPRLA